MRRDRRLLYVDSDDDSTDSTRLDIDSLDRRAPMRCGATGHVLEYMYVYMYLEVGLSSYVGILRVDDSKMEAAEPAPWRRRRWRRHWRAASASSWGPCYVITN